MKNQKEIKRVMKLKIFKKIISVLCAACISTSVTTASVGAITTTNENPEWKAKILNINNRLFILKDLIQIYRERLNKPSVGNDSEESVVKIARASELLYRAEEMVKKLKNLNLDDEETFDLEAFKNNLSTFEHYMRNYALYGAINPETVTEKIIGREDDDEDNGINMDYWNERIDEAIQNNNINNNINNNNNNNINNNAHDNGLIQNILQGFENSNRNLNHRLDDVVQMINDSNFHSAEKKAEVCLKILNQIEYNEDHYKKFENILQNYIDSYIVNSLNNKLRFIDNSFSSKNTLMTTFNNFFRNEPFVVVVRTEIMDKIMQNALSTIEYEKINDPGISDAKKLNRFIDRTLMKNMSKSETNHNELLKSLSKIFKFKGMINYLQIRTISADHLYNEDDLNFTAKQLPKCVEYFQNLIRKLTDTYIGNLSDILNLSDEAFEEEYPNDSDDERIKAIRVARRLGAPIIEIMEAAVNKKLGENDLAFDGNERQNVEDIFARLNQNIEFLCSRIRIRQNNGKLKMRYFHENLHNNEIDIDDDAPQNNVNVNDNEWFQGLNQNAQNNINNNENNISENEDEDNEQFAFNLGYENAIRFQNKEGFNVSELDEKYSDGFAKGENDIKNKNLKELLERTFDGQYPIKDNISIMYKILNLRKNDEYKQRVEAVLNVLNRINDLGNRREFKPVLSDFITSYIDMYLKELERDIKSGKVAKTYIGMWKNVQSQKNKIVTMASNAIEASYLPNRFDSFDKFEAFMYGQLSIFMS